MLQFDTGLPWGELILLVGVLGLAWSSLTLVALVGLGLVALVVAASSATVASTTWSASSLIVISTHLDS